MVRSICGRCAPTALPWRRGAWYSACEGWGVNNTPPTMNPDHPEGWLGLARANAATCGDDASDLGRAIVRLATLAAAAHRAALLDDASPTATAAAGATR